MYCLCLYCDAWSCRCCCIGSMSVSSCICCMCVPYAHPVAVINVTFCMTCSFSMLVKDARDDHMESAYSTAGLMTAFLVTMSVSCCLPHPVSVSVFLSIVVACVLVLRCCECVRCM